jgi:SagB-type dehydrogenase family enzyme
MTAIRDYHERTKHSVASLQSNRHMLDWDNQPLPFKLYTELEPIPLPRDLAASEVAALDAIAATAPRPPQRPLPDLRELARVLHFSAGITRTKRYPGGQVMHFRAAACTGALYHIDLYLVCGDLPDLPAGVYHFGPHDFALRRLRAGDYRRVLVDATAGEPSVAAAPAVLVCTSTFWRNAWKYQARAYRHCFWDSGTILANLLAVAAADGVAARVVLGFVDDAVNALLGVDAEREVALALVALGARPDHSPGAAPPQPPLALATTPLSAHEIDYPLIRAAHRASSLASPADVLAWRAAAVAPPPAPLAASIDLPPHPARSERRLEDVILQRGSTRRFSHRAIDQAGLATALYASTRGIDGDWRGAGAALAQPYLIVNAVDGLSAGTYAYDAGRVGLALLRSGDFRGEAGFLDLGQELAADAAVDLYLLADLDAVLARLGDRGYRAAQLEAAIVGGRFYLAAYALGLGATGLTFFDDEVARFFSPPTAGQGVMFLVAIGHPARRATGQIG